MPVVSLKPNGYGLFYMVVMFENVSRTGVMVIKDTEVSYYIFGLLY